MWLYAKQQPPKEVAAILDENVKGLEAEKQVMRYFNQRLMEMVGQAETSQEQGRIMQAVAQTATRLGELMAVEKRLADAKQKKEDEDFLQSLEELEKNLGGSLGLDQYKED